MGAKESIFLLYSFVEIIEFMERSDSPFAQLINHHIIKWSCQKHW